MTTTVKLPPGLEQSLRRQCAAEGRSISEVMRDALTAYLAQVPTAPPSAWSLGADLFGRHAGPADLAAARHAHAAEVWEQKHSRRSPP
ncbi:MAG: CopG family transcriptional regulator [Burkholderiaceae bacterium]|jgi:plasmid stability protein|nr:CopG family transcriptional regulator [Pseudomonadota bacterium]MBS0597765.1 CopG family transcriptional regulator [Pseudomonadota bacterium]MCO5115882.1 ribbon-helix-helix domain-containing protein [Burkholderiaceae bacterium]MCP5219089.1 CopG family transcriptional regulator [Burkholderiaceae bacterium]